MSNRSPWSARRRSQPVPARCSGRRAARISACRVRRRCRRRPRMAGRLAGWRFPRRGASPWSIWVVKRSRSCRMPARAMPRSRCPPMAACSPRGRRRPTITSGCARRTTRTHSFPRWKMSIPPRSSCSAPTIVWWCSTTWSTAMCGIRRSPPRSSKSSGTRWRPSSRSNSSRTTTAPTTSTISARTVRRSRGRSRPWTIRSARAWDRSRFSTCCATTSRPTVPCCASRR